MCMPLTYAINTNKPKAMHGKRIHKAPNWDHRNHCKVNMLVIKVNIFS